MKINLHPFREKPIPILSEGKRQNLLKFTEITINKYHQLFCENYTNIKDIGLAGDNYYFLESNPPYFSKIDGAIAYLLLRESVALKFKNVNDELKKYGIELYFFDCYRPTKVQSYFYERWVPVAIKKMYPTLSDKEILEKRNLFTAKPSRTIDKIDIDSPSPHSTGAAADVTLRYIDTKQQVFMGTIFDDSTELVFNSYYEKQLSEGNILSISEIEALKNRRVLYWSLKEEGIENYPNEWWHFSYGDQMWAMFSKSKEAFYSKMEVDI